jgi:predicted Zn finger-like uncharacterized protein
MRLICPSCGAQYEVDEAVIPEKGRDVQCSNCGNAWFQQSAAQLRKAEEEAAGKDSAEAAEKASQAEEWVEFDLEGDEADAAPQTDKDDDAPPTDIDDNAPTADSHDGERPSEDTPEGNTTDTAGEDDDAESGGEADDVDEASGDTGADERPEEEDAPDDGGEQEQPATARSATGEGFRRRTLDDAVRNVLREEAERETRARQAEGSDFESQADLGLAAAAGTVAAAGHDVEDRVASMRGIDDGLDDDIAETRASRRELLPDIEEINSTLTATSDRGSDAAAWDAPETLQRNRSGFRRGFSTAILIAALLLVLYMFAPRFSAAVPALEPALNSYVSAVDAGRAWLDSHVQNLTRSLKGDNG